MGASSASRTGRAPLHSGWIARLKGPLYPPRADATDPRLRHRLLGNLGVEGPVPDRRAVEIDTPPPPPTSRGLSDSRAPPDSRETLGGIRADSAGGRSSGWFRCAVGFTDLLPKGVGQVTGRRRALTERSPPPAVGRRGYSTASLLLQRRLDVLLRESFVAQVLLRHLYDVHLRREWAGGKRPIVNASL